MGLICYYLSAVMAGAGLATHNHVGHVFQGSAAVLGIASLAFTYLLGEKS